MIMSLVAAVPPGVYVTEQVAVAVVPAKVHVPANPPLLSFVVRVTCPVGVTNVPGEVSVTVTVQSVAIPMVAGEVHDTVAVTDLMRFVMVRANVAFGLAAE